MLKETAWFPEMRYPVFTEVHTLSEGMFSTDIPIIQGYRRLIEVKGVSSAKTPLKQNYLLISYKDRTTSKWKVFEFREEVDAESEAKVACDVERQREFNERLKKMMPSEKEQQFRKAGNASQCAYWSAMAGKLSQALTNEIKAHEIEDQIPEKERKRLRELRVSRGIPLPENYINAYKKIKGN